MPWCRPTCARLVILSIFSVVLLGLEIFVWYSILPVNLNLNNVFVWLRVGNLVYGLLVNLHGQAGPSEQLLVANVTLEMIGSNSLL